MIELMFLLALATGEPQSTVESTSINVAGLQAADDHGRGCVKLFRQSEFFKSITFEGDVARVEKLEKKLLPLDLKVASIPYQVSTIQVSQLVPGKLIFHAFYSSNEWGTRRRWEGSATKLSDIVEALNRHISTKISNEEVHLYFDFTVSGTDMKSTLAELPKEWTKSLDCYGYRYYFARAVALDVFKNEKQIRKFLHKAGKKDGSFPKQIESADHQ